MYGWTRSKQYAFSLMGGGEIKYYIKYSGKCLIILGLFKRHKMFLNPTMYLLKQVSEK